MQTISLVERMSLIFTIALVRYCIAWQDAHTQLAPERERRLRELRDLTGLARWVYRKDEIGQLGLPPMTAKAVCLQSARRIKRYKGELPARSFGGWDVAPLAPVWADYESVLTAAAERALDASLASDHMRLLVETNEWVSWDCVADARWAAVEQLREVERWLLDIAAENDRTSSRWEDERTGEEQAEDDEDRQSYIDRIDHLDFGAYEERMHHYDHGREMQGYASTVEGPPSGFDSMVEEYSDAWDNPVMIAVDGPGHGFHALVEAERSSHARRIRPGFSPAMALLGRLGAERRRLEDLLLWGEERLPLTPTHPVASHPIAQRLVALRAEFRAARADDKVALAERIARLGRLLASYESGLREPRPMRPAQTATPSWPHTPTTWPSREPERERPEWQRIERFQDHADYAGPSKLRIVYRSPSTARTVAPVMRQHIASRRLDYAAVRRDVIRDQVGS